MMLKYDREVKPFEVWKHSHRGGECNYLKIFLSVVHQYITVDETRKCYFWQNQKKSHLCACDLKYIDVWHLSFFFPPFFAHGTKINQIN